ncbi:MAG: hypothetical protein WDM71_01950 [Ferruginibacter sp.]
MPKPSIDFINNSSVKASDERTGENYLYFKDATDLLFTDNETNTERLFDRSNKSIFVKDAFHSAIINRQNKNELIERKHGTKFSPVYYLNIDGNSSQKYFFVYPIPL